MNFSRKMDFERKEKAFKKIRQEYEFRGFGISESDNEIVVHFSDGDYIFHYNDSLHILSLGVAFFPTFEGIICVEGWQNFKHDVDWFFNM